MNLRRKLLAIAGMAAPFVVMVGGTLLIELSADSSHWPEPSKIGAICLFASVVSFVGVPVFVVSFFTLREDRSGKR